MGAKVHTQTNFMASEWMGITDSGTEVKIGRGVEKAEPYELLLMALSGCLYSTFEDVNAKMKVSYSSVHFDVHGEKRDEIPATLQQVSLKVTVHSGSDEKKIRKAFEIATRYCSVFQTLKHVAEMEWEMEFKN